MGSQSCNILHVQWDGKGPKIHPDDVYGTASWRLRAQSGAAAAFPLAPSLSPCSQTRPAAGAAPSTETPTPPSPPLVRQPRLLSVRLSLPLYKIKFAQL